MMRHVLVTSAARLTSSIRVVIAVRLISQANLDFNL